MKLIKQLSILTFTILFSSCTQNNEEINLRIDKKVGDEQIIISTTETSRGSLMRIKNVIELNLKVSDLNENSYNFTTDILRIKSETKMAGEVESYDSDKKESEMTNDEREMHSEFKSILDSKFGISIDDKGNIIKPFYDLNGSIIETPIVDMSNIQIIFPEFKVKVGTKWESEKTNPITSQKTKTTYKIKDISDKEITISVNSIISGISGLLGENEAIGEYKLDKQSCALIKGTLEMNLQGGGKVTNTYSTK